MIHPHATSIFQILQKNNPHPTTELEYTNVFQLLTAVILSAQATDKSVNISTRKLFQIVSTPQDLLHLGEDNLLPYIQNIGLYRNKAKYLIKMAELLITRHHGEVPPNREALEALPGVGRKTANVVLNTAFGEPTIAVDTHIFRVANRLGLAKAATPLAVEQQLEKSIPTPFKKDAHHWLILHGRYICRARKPLCAECMIARYCVFFKSNT